MTKFFLSHSDQDHDFARDLRRTLADHGQDGWIDSRETRNRRGRDESGKYRFPVIPLLLDGARLGAFGKIFGDEPNSIPVSSDPGGVEAAIDPLLVALGERLPLDVSAAPRPEPEPIEKLVLELTDLEFREQDGVSRAAARARLRYQPATKAQREVTSPRWRFLAPLGPIEAEDLRWYLEEYSQLARRGLRHPGARASGDRARHGVRGPIRPCGKAGRAGIFSPRSKPMSATPPPRMRGKRPGSCTSPRWPPRPRRAQEARQRRAGGRSVPTRSADARSRCSPLFAPCGRSWPAAATAILADAPRNWIAPWLPRFCS